MLGILVGGLSLCRLLRIVGVQFCKRLLDVWRSWMNIAARHFVIGVPCDFLNSVHLTAGLTEPRQSGVPQNVRTERGAYSLILHARYRSVVPRFHRPVIERATSIDRREHPPFSGRTRFIVSSEESLSDPGRRGNIALSLLGAAFGHMNEAVLAINGWREVHVFPAHWHVLTRSYG